MRIQPYLAPSSSPGVGFKALQILENTVSFMSGRPLVPEHKPETFSPEEGNNVKIVCALSATAYELMPNFKALLTSAQGK